MRRPGLLRRINVKAGALSKIVGLVIGHSVAARRGVGENQRQPLLGRVPLQARLDHCILMG